MRNQARRMNGLGRLVYGKKARCYTLFCSSSWRRAREGKRMWIREIQENALNNNNRNIIVNEFAFIY